jgi:ubiquinone biosynthesis protein
MSFLPRPYRKDNRRFLSSKKGPFSQKGLKRGFMLSFARGFRSPSMLKPVGSSNNVVTFPARTRAKCNRSVLVEWVSVTRDIRYACRTMAQTLSRMKRYAQVVAIGSKHDLGWFFDKIGLGSLLSGKDDAQQKDGSSLTYAERIRLVFEELGPTYIKLGQLLSTRPDLIPRDYIDEFKKLQDNVSTLPFEQIKETIEHEMSAPLSDVFLRFEEKPLAAASIAQVHRAWLADDLPVAVKVQRPGIEDVIKQDLAILYDLARLARTVLTSMAEMVDPVLIVREFERSILRELDFVNEGHLTDEFRHNLKHFQDIRVAEVHWKCTTKRILTMEFFDGLKVSEIEAIKKKGYDLRRLASLMTRVTLQTVFHDGLFHADPHPGNLLVLEDQSLAVIDFGMVGRFDRQTMQMLRAIAFAMARRNYDELAQALLQYGVVGWDVDLRKLSRKIREVFRSMIGNSTSLAQQSEVLMEFLIQEKLYYQPDLILLDKTFGTLEGSIRTLCPDLDIAALFEEFAPELGKNLLSPKEMLADFLTRLFHMDEVLIDTPPLFHRVLGRLDAGKLTIRVERSLGSAGMRELASLVLACAMCALGLVLLGGAFVTRDHVSAANLFGQPFWPAFLGTAGASAFLGGTALLYRLSTKA